MQLRSFLSSLAIAFFLLTGCDSDVEEPESDESVGEEFGESVDEAADDTEDAVDEAGDEVDEEF